MTIGADMKRTPADIDRTFSALRPAALDALAEDAYARRRDADIDEITRSGEPARAARPRPLRRPTLLVASVATACATVAGMVVVSAARDDAPRAVTTQRPSGPTDARGVLLASAQTVERTRETPGRYWYTKWRMQTLSNIRLTPGGDPRKAKLPYTYRRTTTEERWLSRTGRDRSRSITGIDDKVDFPTPQDEAKWRSTGAPRLTGPHGSKPRVLDDHQKFGEIVANEPVTVDALLKLPTDADALTADLKRRYKRDVRRSGEDIAGPFEYFVWSTAESLLAGPITPGTKAAFYRVLAEQPGIRTEGRTTDPLGRAGVAVSMSGEGYSLRLIVDPGTGRLLAAENRTGDTPGARGSSVTYLDMGWVDRLDARP
ncbi:CU044_5270 family protein [Actinomadura miaoliensis]|uniref:CU044_5270 family protein n=1 Tax=Actinomadura miaoliensis TaxID=430685 RepID=A0ABP7WQJ4_9ACTN